MTPQRSAVVRVAWIGPSNPLLQRSGKAPEWSMCTWERTTASTAGAANGSARFRASDSALLPWKRPQSRSTLPDRPVRRCLEPVTVRAAPQKVTRIPDQSPGYRWIPTQICAKDVNSTLLTIA